MRWEAEIDERGRILILGDLREELKLGPGQKIQTEVERRIVIEPLIHPEEFMEEMNGCVSGSRTKAEDLKEVWGC